MRYINEDGEEEVVDVSKWSYLLVPIEDVDAVIRDGDTSPDGNDEIRIRRGAPVAYIKAREVES